MTRQTYQPGDWVIFRVTKFSSHPGPRAENIAPAPHGESYHYTVDKFWIVEDRTKDGRLILRTRRGKQHVVEEGDARLRKANLWERWRFRFRFEEIERSQHVADADRLEPQKSSTVAT